jgi:hypothetical protein
VDDAEIAKLKAVAGRLRRARDDADEALLAVETLIELAMRRRPAATVTPIRKDGDHG